MEKDWNELLLENRRFRSKRFVEPCWQWVLRKREAVNDPLFAPLHSPAEEEVVVMIAAKVEAYQQATDRRSQLLTAEDLADIILAFVNTPEQRLRPRTPPTDAVEFYYEIGGGDQCSACHNRFGFVSLPGRQDELCAHCYYQALDASSPPNPHMV